MVHQRELVELRTKLAATMLIVAAGTERRGVVGANDNVGQELEVTEEMAELSITHDGGNCGKTTGNGWRRVEGTVDVAMVQVVNVEVSGHRFAERSCGGGSSGGSSSRNVGNSAGRTSSPGGWSGG